MIKNNKEGDIIRCHWVNESNPLYIKYHDEEWCVPSHDDGYLFELLVLESFQAGLSWECILNKRENFRKAFDNFDYFKISHYEQEKIDSLLNDKGIIRNKLKIKAAINNAKVFISIQEEFDSFNNYIWSFTNNKIIINNGELVTSSPLSDKISKDLQKRGMKFVGTTIVYSYLQAIGIVNDHEKECDMFNNEIVK